MSARRDNPLLFERNGAFNPGWLYYMLYATIGIVLIGAAVYVALTNPNAWALLVVAFSFVAFGMLSTAIMVVSLARAKVIAPALDQSVKAIGASAEFVAHEWTAGDPQAGVM